MPAADAEAPQESAATKRRWPAGVGFALNVLVALLVVSLVQGFVVKVFNVPSGSMEQTLGVGDRILVNRLAYGGADPEPGDVVVFAAAGDWEPAAAPKGPLRRAAEFFGDLTGIGPASHHYLVKRVVGTSGDTVECCDDAGSVLLEGEPLDEPYIHNDYPFEPGVQDCTSDVRSLRCFGPLEVPEGSLLVLGDHRSNSADSVIGCRGRDPGDGECLRAVDADTVVGRVVLKIWPLGRDGLD
ncbi:signal peptidase I [Zhihengliuella halotolerans]|uniref:Signal peptidase I n=1 Tax=Zhihengliuella halotolerans TaxID=370736 RepID=A0A4Q8ACW5_9MICC|nr:signal peptidase I [Zhihengliuella halotolerans]